MKIDKVIKIPLGSCSETVVWTVGDDYCYIIGTYPEVIRKDLVKGDIEDKPAWKFLLDYLGEKIK